LLQHLERVPPVRTHRHPVIFGKFAAVLDQVAPPLLGERRDRDADELPIVQGVQTQIGALDRLVDGADHALVERRYDEQGRPGRMMLKTRIGMSLSMQREIAVASITWSWRFSTSM